MADSNKYIDMSAKEALKLAKDKYLLLPDIQREYVWSMEDIEKLFESIVDGYPIGSCIFWKTNKKTLNAEKPNLYFFLREFKREESKNEKASEVFGEEGDYYIVLDGQQRITSLNIALYGSYTCYKGGRGRSKSDPKYWITRELYYNLDYYKNEEDEEKDDENPPKRFSFLTKEDANNGNYYKVKNILAFDDDRALLRELIKAGYEEIIQNDLCRLFSRIHSSGSDGIVHYYCISENTYDEALDIFVRVNSTGRKLSKSDLLFSTLIDGWKEGKENIENTLKSANSKGDSFSFSRDYLMRLLLVLADAPTNLKIESFDKKTIQKIRDDWKNLSKTFINMVETLVSIGLSDGFLTSYNATMPIVYFIYKGGKINSEGAKKEIRKFLSISMAKRLFGVASNDALRSTRAALQSYDCKKNPFVLSIFDSVTLTGNRTFKVEETDIDYWLDNYTIGPNTYIILSLLYPTLKLSQESFHQDHCHPHVSFDDKPISSLGLSEETVREWQYKRNLLPNLQFLEGRENESKNKTPLKDWIADGNTIKFLPSGVSLELKDFDDFFTERRKLIRGELIRIFNIKITTE